MVGRRRGRLPFYAISNIQRSAVPLQRSPAHRYRIMDIQPSRDRERKYIPVVLNRSEVASLITNLGGNYQSIFKSM
jgi:hypothetical protein